MSRSGSDTLAFLLLVSLLLIGADTASADSTPSPSLAVQELNRWRAEVGVSPVSEDPEQSEGCKAHANYYRLNHQMGHFEDPALPGYTPAGAKAAASSVLSFGGAKDGPFTWEDAVYHRAGLLNPRLVTTGFWAEFELGCMGVFGTDDARTTPTMVAYTYPYNGQQGIGTTFGCLEIPNPCESVPGNNSSDATGFISSVQFNGPWSRIQGTRVAVAQLAPDGGAPLPITVEDEGNGNGGFLDGGFDVIPQQPLAEGTWYTGSATGTVEAAGPGFEEISVPFSVSWRFKTILVPRNPGLTISVAGGRPRISSSSPTPVELTIRDGGTRQFSLPLQSVDRGRYRATAPTGRLRTVRWQVCASQPADAGGVWKPDRTCTRGGPLSLDVDVLYASKYLVRLRVKAPSPAVGRPAQVVMKTADGRRPERVNLILQPKARLDLRGIPATGASLRVAVKPFRKRGVPQRVRPVSTRLHWAAAPSEGGRRAQRRRHP